MLHLLFIRFFFWPFITQESGTLKLKKTMLNNRFYFFIFQFSLPFLIFAQEFNDKAFLKDYAGDLVITTQVRGERNKAILRGTEAKKNREFVLQNYRLKYNFFEDNKFYA